MSQKTAHSNAKAAMAKQLALVLADTYVLAVKTHAYHWNVVGVNFRPLHAFFSEQYNALFEAADDIAERIRALGYPVEGSMTSFLQDTVIKEAGAKKMTDSAMLKDLLVSHRTLRDRLAETENLADELDDVASEDLMVERLRAHDKTLWMIKSHLE